MASGKNEGVVHGEAVSELGLGDQRTQEDTAQCYRLPRCRETRNCVSRTSYASKIYLIYILHLLLEFSKFFLKMPICPSTAEGN